MSDPELLLEALACYDLTAIPHAARTVEENSVVEEGSMFLEPWMKARREEGTVCDFFKLCYCPGTSNQPLNARRQVLLSLSPNP